MKKLKIIIGITLCTVFLLVGCNEKVDKNIEKSISKDESINIIEKQDEVIEKNSKSENNNIEKDTMEIESKEVDIEKNSKDSENKEIKTIVIDPGHSSVGNPKKEPIAPNSSKTKAKDVLGATGSYTNIPEHKTTVSIALLLKDELVDKGYNVVMTKSEVDKSLSNIERAQIGNDNNADLVIRIHADSSNDKNVKGASILIPSKNEYTKNISDISMNYGKEIIDTYTNELNIKNRGCIYRDDMTGFNWSKVPVVILEMGFLSNKDEDEFISNEKNHSNIASVIATGIDKCFK